MDKKQQKRHAVHIGASPAKELCPPVNGGKQKNCRLNLGLRRLNP
jgi:hypothetical protein